MKIFLKQKIIILILGIVFFLRIEELKACSKQKRGHYEGYLRIYSDQKTNFQKLDSSETKWVAVDLLRIGRNGEIQITDPKLSGKKILDHPIYLSAIQFSGLRISIPSIGGIYDLERHKDCYYSSKNSSYLVRACLKEKEDLELLINHQNGLPIFKLIASPYSLPNLPDTPLNLSLAIKVALTTNPASYAELARKLQVKNNSIAAWIRAFAPKLNLPNAISIAYDPLNPLTYVGAIGNLAPFLSIGSSFDAVKSNLLTKVADLSYEISRADLAVQVESLVYAYRRDLAIYNEYELILRRSKIIRDKVKEIELAAQRDKKPYITPGSSVTMDVIVRNLENSKGDALAILAADKYALARALGIQNVEKVQNIKIGIESNPLRSKDFTYASPIKSNEIINLSWEVSLERQQADLLLQIGHLDKLGIYIRLLDPVGDPTKGLGLNTIWEGKTAEGKIDELRHQLKEMDNQIEQGVRGLVAQFNNCLYGFKISLKSLQDTLQILEREENIIHQFYPENFKDTITAEFDIQNAYGIYMSAFIQNKNYLAGFRIARANLDRIQLQGYYESFRKNKGTLSTSYFSQLAEDDEILDTTLEDLSQDENNDLFFDKINPSFILNY